MLFAASCSLQLSHRPLDWTSELPSGPIIRSSNSPCILIQPWSRFYVLAAHTLRSMSRQRYRGRSDHCRGAGGGTPKRRSCQFASDRSRTFLTPPIQVGGMAITVSTRRCRSVIVQYRGEDSELYPEGCWDTRDSNQQEECDAVGSPEHQLHTSPPVDTTPQSGQSASGYSRSHLKPSISTVTGIVGGRAKLLSGS